MAYIINFLGGPSTGKSTIASRLYSLFKEQTDIKTEHVNEYAKEITYQKNNMALADQMLITSNHHHRLFMLNEIVDLIVTDSSLLNATIYEKYSQFPEVSLIATEAAKKLYSIYKNINILLYRDGVGDYEEHGREQTKEQAIGTDKDFEFLFESYKDSSVLNINMKNINGDVDFKAKYIMNKIVKEFFNEKSIYN